MDNNEKKNSTGRKVGLVLSLAAAAGLVFGGTSYATRSAVEYLVNDKNASVAEAAQAEEPTAVTFSEKEQKAQANEAASETADVQEAEDAAVPAEQAASDAQTMTSTPVTEPMSVADVSDYVMPSMVAITNTSVESLNDYFGGYGGFDLFGGFGMPGFGGYGNGGDETFESVSKGSGIILGITDDMVYIATNAHVVDGAQELSVTFIDEESYEGTVVGADTDNDLAVVSLPVSDISADTLSKIKAIDLGDSDAARIGEQVVAIGNALGYGQSTSVGYLSAKNRALDSSAVEGGLLQTDAAINPGNSGGALLNMYGQLIGINSSKYADTDVEGMGFAIPINYAQPILQSMIEGGTAPAESDEQMFGDLFDGRPFSGRDADEENPFSGENRDDDEDSYANENGAYMGIECYTVTEQTASFYGVPTGVLVNSVIEGTPAEAAGLEAGDIITALDGQTVTSQEDLTSLLASYEPGDTAELTVSRSDFSGNYREGTLNITFGSRSAA